jgi:hypothetical protein
MPAGGDGDIMVVDSLPISPPLLALIDRHIEPVLSRRISVCNDRA